MLTQHKPERKRVGNTDEDDLYIIPGDGVGFRHMCSWSAKHIWGVELEPMQMVRVWVLGGKLSAAPESFPGLFLLDSQMKFNLGYLLLLTLIGALIFKAIQIFLMWSGHALGMP